MKNSFVRFFIIFSHLQGSAVSSTMENTLTASSSSSEALCTTQAVSSSASLDVVPASSSRLTEHGDVHIIVEKQTSSEGTDKLHNSSTHIVVHNKTSSSRIIRTVVSWNASEGTCSHWLPGLKIIFSYCIAYLLSFWIRWIAVIIANQLWEFVQFIWLMYTLSQN